MCSEHENLGLFRVGRCASFGQLGPVQVPPTPPHVLDVLQDHFGVAQVVDLVYFCRLQIKYEKSKYLLKSIKYLELKRNPRVGQKIDILFLRFKRKLASTYKCLVAQVDTVLLGPQPACNAQLDSSPLSPAPLL